MVNLHFSLLPRWRGAAPVERAILEGDAETGVCLMAVEAGLDTGPIYAEDGHGIGEEETADELRSRLVAIGCRLLEEHLADGLSGTARPPRPGRRAVLRREDPARRARTALGPARPSQIRRVVRLGRAWTTFRGRRLARPPGHRRPSADGRRVRVRPGTLDGHRGGRRRRDPRRLVTVQPEGRRPMDADDWLRGVRPATRGAAGGVNRRTPAGPVPPIGCRSPWCRRPIGARDARGPLDPLGRLRQPVRRHGPGGAGVRLAARRRDGRALRPQPDRRPAGGGVAPRTTPTCSSTPT